MFLNPNFVLYQWRVYLLYERTRACIVIYTHVCVHKCVHMHTYYILILPENFTPLHTVATCFVIFITPVKGAISRIWWYLNKVIIIMLTTTVDSQRTFLSYVRDLVFSLVATEAMHGHRIACDATVPASNFVPRNISDIRAVNKPDYMLRYNSAPVFVLCKSYTCSCFLFIKVSV